VPVCLCMYVCLRESVCERECGFVCVCEIEGVYVFLCVRESVCV